MVAVADLVRQLTTGTGTGSFTLSAVNGYQTFNEAFGTGGTDLFYYFISHNSADEWEYGTGHLSDATTLVRDTVIGGTNGTSKVSFAAGVKDVMNDIPSILQARRIHIGATAPASPTAGQQWFDTTVGALYTYIDDGDTSQWVEMGATTGSTMTMGKAIVAALIFG
jgi:hypothetical protein